MHGFGRVGTDPYRDPWEERTVLRPRPRESTGQMVLAVSCVLVSAAVLVCGGLIVGGVECAAFGLLGFSPNLALCAWALWEKLPSARARRVARDLEAQRKATTRKRLEFLARGR